jgi:hypothetical protein
MRSSVTLFRFDFPHADQENFAHVRLGLLGPADGNVDGLGRAAELLLNVAKADRAIYLGTDGALDEAVARWAKKLVGEDPTDDAAWRRAARVAASGTPEAIDAFVKTERARLRLRALESLPDRAHRSMEMIGDRVAVLVYDKSLLDEEDIFAANILIFGKHEGPLVKKIGTRWFVSPGPIGSKGGGAAVLDDEQEDIITSVYDLEGKVTQKEALVAQRAPKMKIQGGGA